MRPIDVQPGGPAAAAVDYLRIVLAAGEASGVWDGLRTDDFLAYDSPGAYTDGDELVSFIYRDIDVAMATRETGFRPAIPCFDLRVRNDGGEWQVVGIGSGHAVLSLGA